MPMKTNEREYRSLTLNAVDDELIVEGYATTYNEPYCLCDCGDYRVMEQVGPHAFDSCDMSDVIMQYNHEGRVFARTRNGSLQLTSDNHGLRIRADLSGTDIGKQLYQEIKGGYTDRMSFGFIVSDDKRESQMIDGVEVVTRTITGISKLFDVSAVSIPANDGTSISARKYSDGVIESIKAERLERANKRKKLQILLEVSKNDD